MNQYPAKYSDAHGSEDTIITNDGETLRMLIRGVAFTGADFDSLDPSEGTTPTQLTTFTIHRGSLCSCHIECQIKIPIHDNGEVSSGMLEIDLHLGDPAPNGGIDREDIAITLLYNEQRFPSSGKSGWFEFELIEIQEQLPENIYMRACINCRFSDYSPYGHGLFGSMMCFRNIKEEYLKVMSKKEFWSVHDRYERMVQETYLCDDFQRRIPDTGYRG